MKQAKAIEGTPLSISIYSVQSAPAELCQLGQEEIIFCLKGSVNVSFFYRDVTLHEGEFLSINHDAFYMSSDEDNLCVSIYIDTQKYEKYYPNIRFRQHVCVGAYSEIYTPIMGYPTRETDNLKGMLLTLLHYYCSGKSKEELNRVTELIIESLIEDFDVIYFMNGNKDIKEEVHRNLTNTAAYVYRHYDGKYTMKNIAGLLGISPNYVNEYLRKAGISLKLLRGFAKVYAAERMLIETDKTILEIAEESGFSGPKYLYSIFTEWMGCTPNEFRNTYCKKRETIIKYYEKDILKDILEGEMIDHFLDFFSRSEE